MVTEKQDKRRYERRRARVAARLMFHGPDRRKTVTTLDLSAQGARFSNHESVRTDKPVIVQLRLDPHGVPIECKGRVCWSKKMPDSRCHFGVRFVDLNEEEQWRVSEFLGAGHGAMAHA